jgi:TonB family protein
MMRQLQALWDARAYYPRHASNNDEGGTVKVHLVILPDGRFFSVDVVESSGSRSLDSAGYAVFQQAFVRPFPQGEPRAEIDISLHYVLAHRHDQPVPAGYTPVSSKSPFTIMNDPVTSPILETMLQRTCTGTVVLGGLRNHPWYGMQTSAQAIFFRKPDGTPWVKFYHNGFPIVSPVTEVGKMLQWTGATAHTIRGEYYYQFTVWADGDNHLSGAVGSKFIDRFGNPYNQNVGAPVDFICATEVLPEITLSGLPSKTIDAPPGDPP